ncbi:hypothetical protein IHE55_23620 [Streptomyces pactum]|uniref:Histidine kinase n=1 Tax=Streptomyces pactum TaxID=68249 RepID=A0ABS0NR25_9ACTN|nr:hypothetical protein [Streptomyces pactum]MBH5337591.1 hypothetical protein [Streptomyces pactum]
MIEWRLISSAARPVPPPVNAPTVWAAALVSAPAVVAVHNLLNGHGDPLLDTIALCVVAAVLGAAAPLAAAPGTALVCWTFISLFATPPMGRFSWTVYHDVERLGCLLLAAAVGTVGARLIHARAAYRRIPPAG